MVEQFPPDPITASEWIASIDKFVNAITRARDSLPSSALTMLRQHMALNERRFIDSEPIGDILDAMLDATIDLRKDTPPEYARARPELAKVYGAARTCVKHGIKVSASERSRFMSIVRVIVPERSDHRALVRQAKEGVDFPINS
ncbi:hypothetical protein NYA30BAC_01196 [Halomonas sp. NYA30]